MNPLTMEQVKEQLLAAARELKPEEIEQTVAMVRRLIEVAAPFVPTQYRLALLVVDVLVEWLYREMLPELRACSADSPLPAEAGYAKAGAASAAKAGRGATARAQEVE